MDKKSKKVHKIYEQEIYLVPELCYMTGMTDKMKADFNLNKDISVTTKSSAGDRMKNTISLIDDLMDPKKERTFKCFNDWNIMFLFNIQLVKKSVINIR